MIKTAAAICELDKLAGVTSEYASGINPLNILGGPIGGLAAALTPTRTDEEQEEAGTSGLSNLLIPGVGQYNYMKRLGHSADKARGGYGAVATELVGGFPAALASGIYAGSNQNSGLAQALNIGVGAAPLVGALSALLTRTRSLDEQKTHDESTAAQLANLIPGVGAYNLMKRLGSTKIHDEKGEDADREIRAARILRKRTQAREGLGLIGSLARDAAAGARTGNAS